MHFLKLDVLYDPTLDESEVIQSWMFCTIYFNWDDSEHACKSSNSGSVVYNPLLDDSEHASK